MTALSPDGFESLADYLRRTNPLVAELMRRAEYRLMCHRTRRIVEVTARKYRARRRRKN